MVIEYAKHVSRRPTESHSENLGEWLMRNLQRGSTEAQLYKLQRLLTLVAADWAQRNPEELPKVSEAIFCEGHNHKLVGEEGDAG